MGLRRVFLLHEGIRGHLTQSRGVAHWLERLAGASVLEMEVPAFSGFQAAVRKLRSFTLKTRRPQAFFRWLSAAGGLPLLESAKRALDEEGILQEEALVLSAGSTPAPYALSIARALGCRCATIMTPSVLGTDLFDFAIVPEHDHPRPSPHLLVTLGAPNDIDPETLKAEAGRLAADFPPFSPLRWALLLGGDDANYRISPQWVEGHLAALFDLAEKKGADVYATTSRRTSAETEEAAERVASSSSSIRFFLWASKEASNPVPALLGLCQTVFCTEDSISMVSEAATAGRAVGLLRVERKKGARFLWGETVFWLHQKGYLPERALFGPRRFDATFESFKRTGLLFEWDDPALFEPPKKSVDFNEAKRAARFILSGWEKNR